MKKLLAALLVCCASGAWAQTGTPKTQTQMSTEIGTTGCVQPTCQFPDNTTGLITPLGLRTALQDLNATLFGAKVVYATSYGVKCDGAANDTANINTALIAAANQVLVFPPGSCLVTPGSITISNANANVPQRTSGYGTTFTAASSVASPLIAFDKPQGTTDKPVFEGFRLSCAAGLAAYGIKIHGSQYAVYRDIEILGTCSAGGLWLSGEPSFGIYYNDFENIFINGMTGPGLIAKSINNVGVVYIAANRVSGLQSQFNTTYGADLDYASISFLDSDFETNTTAGVNIDHSLQVDFIGGHFEGNNGGATAITTTANTNGLRVIGGRTIGSITTSAKTNPANFFQTSDASGLPVISNTGLMSYIATGVNFNSGNTDTSIPITLPTGYTRYRVVFVSISGASQTLTTATAGLFTAAAGAGVAIVTAASAVTVSTAADATVNNMQQMAINNAATESYTATTLFFRVATAQGAAATGNVQITIQPVS